MKVISLHGTDDRLYQLVARLVMDPDVLRQNNNYPFKTTSEYVWHLCVGDDGGVVGFLPVKATDRGFYIDNYYVGSDEQAVLDLLIGHVLLQTTRPVTILAHKRHSQTLKEHGFITSTVFAQYNRMQCVRRIGDDGR